MSALARAGAIVGIAIRQVRASPARTAFATVAVAVAVLSVTLFASAGLGVLAFGEESFDRSGRDLWIAGGPVELSPTVGVENPIADAHRVSDDVAEREDVRSAAPIAFHAVYVDAPGHEPELVTAMGTTGTHDGASLEAGEGFSRGDAHYANGTYDGPRSDEVIVDPDTADRLDLAVGDTVTVATSPDGEGREVTVVGISDEYAAFLGTATVTMPLSELQALAGTTGSDRATFVAVQVEDDADPAAVREALAAEYPEYEVRTNREQLETMLESRVLLVASAAALVALAVLLGSGVLLNVLVLAVVDRADALAALHLVGTSRGTLVSIVFVRAVVVGALGGALGLAATPPAAAATNAVAARVVGFEGLLRVTPTVYALGAGVAATVSLVGAVAVGWYLSGSLAADERRIA